MLNLGVEAADTTYPVALEVGIRLSGSQGEVEGDLTAEDLHVAEETKEEEETQAFHKL